MLLHRLAAGEVKDGREAFDAEAGAQVAVLVGVHLHQRAGKVIATCCTSLALPDPRTAAAAIGHRSKCPGTLGCARSLAQVTMLALSRRTVSTETV